VVGDAPDVNRHRPEEAVAAVVGEAGVRPAAVGLAGRPLDVAGALQPVDAPGQAAPREQDAVGEVAHPERAAGGVELGEDVEVGQREVLLRLELGLERPDQRRVGGQERPPCEHAGAVGGEARRRDDWLGHRIPRCGRNEDSNPGAVDLISRA